eukprot:m.130748 g.130748  ORF g.130748 m.130748 type:complete len:97 (-) comp13727_c0_seq1:1711-2001(-)
MRFNNRRGTFHANCFGGGQKQNKKAIQPFVFEPEHPENRGSPENSGDFDVSDDHIIGGLFPDRLTRWLCSRSRGAIRVNLAGRRFFEGVDMTMTVT